jgi:predicted nucleic acid-binding protein
MNTLDKFVSNLASGGFEIKPITSELAVEIAKMRHSSRLKMPDSCVLALAKSIDAELISADKQLAERSTQLKVKTRLLG